MTSLVEKMEVYNDKVQDLDIILARFSALASANTTVTVCGL